MSKKLDFNVAAEMRAFYLQLDDPTFQRELKGMLPDNISVEAFVRTAKTAVQNNQGLLDPKWRGSLLRSVSKAAAQGLLPDGKHGCLIPRQDNAAGGTYQVCWQPMVWGITQLGRRAGALKKMTAHLVFDGEEFEVLGGAEDRIHHKINPIIVEKAYAESKTPDEFLQRIAFAYCIFTAPDGTETWRWMPRSRIARVRAASKAANGPWGGSFVDEMALKTVILFTAKHIDLDGDTPELRRFRDAMETDMEADLEGEAVEVEGPPDAPALPAPSPALDRLAEQLSQGLTDKVVGDGEKVVATEPPTAQPQQQQPAPDETETAKEQQRQQKGEKVSDEAVARAEKFAQDTRRVIFMAAQHTAPEAELSDVFRNAAVVSKIKRLKRDHSDLYKREIIGVLTHEKVSPHIGVLQNDFDALYADATAALAQQQEAPA